MKQLENNIHSTRAQTFFFSIFIFPAKFSTMLCDVRLSQNVARKTTLCEALVFSSHNTRQEEAIMDCWNRGTYNAE